MRLVQVADGFERMVCLVDRAGLFPVPAYESVYALAMAALADDRSIRELVECVAGETALDYDAVYEGRSEWRLLPCADHPHEAARCLVSGTGLTHLRSAANRQAMHAAQQEITDSMRMYEWGVEGGRPPLGEPGVSPEWFYKGSGMTLKAHAEPLTRPAHSEDGGEEPEVAGVYVIGPEGTPWRIGMAAGNEFSDHKLERRNYLYLAASKLRECAIGPEIAIDPEFRSVSGRVWIERGGATVWSREIRTGEEAMSHSLANLEHHHFKHAQHRRPGDVHIHFFGADAFSFGEGVTLEDGDVMSVEWEGFGRALRNPLRVEPGGDTLVKVRSLGRARGGAE